MTANLKYFHYEILTEFYNTICWRLPTVICTFYCHMICKHLGSHNVHVYYPLTPNDSNSGRTAPLTSKRCILYIYSTNIGTEYFKHGIYCPSFSLQNAVCFTILTYLVPVLFTFYILCVPKFKKIIPTPKG